MTTAAPERRVTVTEAEEAAWEEVESTLPRITARPRTESFDPARYCNEYRTIRPFLVKGLPLLDKIPFAWSRGVVKAIRFLMVLADGTCPAR